jgi:two-component system response regulator FixJ
MHNGRSTAPDGIARPLLEGCGLVCVVDDDASFRRSLARLLKSADLSAQTFASATDYLAHPEFAGPCCLVLDVCMPGLDGLALQKTLAHRSAQIVFLTGHGDIPMCARAMQAGAVDFLTKPVDAAHLLAAVRLGLARSAAARAALAERERARARLGTLTPREFEVMQRVLTGALNKQIAGELGAAEKTIKIHRGRVMQKLGVGSVAGLVRLAQAAGVQVEPMPAGR